MQIIRDNELSGILMIPLFSQYNINRCNIKDCTEKPTTVCIHEIATFGICEKHYQQYNEAGTVNLSLEFDN